MWAGFAAYLAFLAAAPALGRRLVWATIALLVAAFAVAPVLLSHDVYSYADPAFAKVDWVDTTSAYGPLFTLATYPLAWLPVGAAVAVLKAAAALSVLGLALVVARLAAWRGADPLRAAAFVALNPLVLVHVVGGAHNDGLAMLLALLGVAALLAAREASAGAALVAAVAVKASTAVVAPFALLARARPTARDGQPPLAAVDARRRSTRSLRNLLAGAALAALAIAAAAYAGFGWDWLHALGLAGENQGRTSHMSIPIAVARLTGLDPNPVRAAALALYAALVAYLLVRVWRGGDWVRASGWATLGLLLATAWLLPWYLVWLLPLAAVARDRPLQLLALALTAYQLGARIPL